MSKTKYVGEFELKASVRMLYPYVSTASGLAEWFADDVNHDPKRNFVFHWNGERALAKQVSIKGDNIRYEFLGADGKPVKDPNFIEFHLVDNEMTSTTFLQIVDYSEMDSKEDMDELYSNLVHALKEIVGG